MAGVYLNAVISSGGKRTCAKVSQEFTAPRNEASAEAKDYTYRKIKTRGLKSSLSKLLMAQTATLPTNMP